ncbi:MAG: CorA family divalent cation transporter [Patescibacteria group bacterium]
MIITRTLKNYSWVDVSSPSKEDIDSLILTYNVDASIAKDLFAPTPKQKIQEYGDSFYIVIHFPIINQAKDNVAFQEIDCIVSKDRLITVRYSSVDILHHFAKKMEAEEILVKSGDEHPFLVMMKEVYKYLNDEVYSIDNWLRDIEKGVFKGREKIMVISISSVSRHLLNFRRTISPHSNIWQSFHSDGERVLGREFSSKTPNVASDLRHITSAIDNLLEMVKELRETNNSLLSTKQNEIVQTLTILAFITVPLALISQIFGMGTESTPLIGLKYDFWIVMAIMALMALTMYIYFRLKKWL